MRSTSGVLNKLVISVRHFVGNMVHWIFVMQYYRTSVMLPKIFHEIMIDDFIEGGKFYTFNSSLRSSV